MSQEFYLFKEQEQKSDTKITYKKCNMQKRFPSFHLLKCVNVNNILPISYKFCDGANNFFYINWSLPQIPTISTIYQE